MIYPYIPFLGASPGGIALHHHFTWGKKVKIWLFLPGKYINFVVVDLI